MKSWKKPTDEMVDKALDSVKKITARKYFFSRLENPLWLKPLTERGCFKSPPKTQRFDDGTSIYPYWPEIQYLKNVCRDAPDEVINLVVDLPEVDNPVVYDGILYIALELPGKQSAKLKDKVLEYANMEHYLRTHKYADLLGHWTAENQTSAALELSKILVAFAPDPQARKKQKLRKENPMSGGTLLQPSPRFDFADYHEIMLKGIRPLAEREPYKVACLLMDATANMIRLRTHQADFANAEDSSEIWCPRLREEDSGYETSEQTLVHTLTFACEKVFEKSADAAGDLDKVLRKKQWKIFSRLRHHLYALNLNEQTKPWLRELILAQESYGVWEHHYEFQQMVRRACKHFKETLLTEAERTDIFNTILEGPSKENYQHWVEKWIGEKFSEERFKERQRHFHWMQFAPFAQVLFGKYKAYFQALEHEADKPISDEDYPPFKPKIGWVTNRSPQPPEDLANLTDEELLAFINEWEKEDEYAKGNLLVKINIEALANAFQVFFRESIIPDADRLGFWLDNRERIERPIYVRMMINAMETNVKAKNFDQLNQWLIFSEWALTHPDQKHEADHRKSEQSRENPSWSSTRSAVCDFIGVCLEKDVDVPVTAREQLSTLLKMLCTQFDWRLDKNVPIVLNRYEPLTEGVNSTRGRALENLVKFGFWLRRHDSECEVRELTATLEKRFAPEAEYPLTLPEYAVLGSNYYRIFRLDAPWANKHKSDFFPQTELPAWLAAFSSTVDYSAPSVPIFETLQDDFDFALQHLTDFKKSDSAEQETIDMLGQHLFTYYLWEMYPLKGEKSLLEQYYQKTDNLREHWGDLFNDIGRRSRNSGKDLDQNMKERIIAFFEWRLKQEESTELRHFTFWLESECLDAEWRLNAYSEVLDICQVENGEFHLETLCKMLPAHTPKVVECFFKLTEWIKKGNSYVQVEEAKTILKAGLKSGDENVRHMAKKAHDNLLKSSRFDLLNLVD